jgi:hypothetical protein
MVPSSLLDPLVKQAFLKFFGGIIGRHVIINGFHPCMGPYVNEACDFEHINRMNQLEKCHSVFERHFNV